MPNTNVTPHTWTFLSNYAHVLICLAEDPSTRMRDVAERVGITERAAQRIIGHLEQAGAVRKERDGRRNHYWINVDQPLRHPVESHRTIGNLLKMVLTPNQVARVASPR